MSSLRPAAPQGSWHLGGESFTIRLGAEQSGGEMVVLETFSAPGGAAPGLHRHGFMETFHVLDGAFEFDTRDEDGDLRTFPAEAGATLFVPSMGWHRFRNVGTAAGRLLTIFTTGAIEEMARAVGQPIDDPRQPAPAAAPAPSEEAMRTVGRLMAEHRIEMLPPG